LEPITSGLQKTQSEKMPKPKITTKGNPVTPLPKKNKVIFTKLIPTIRSIQEKKYWQDAPGKQSDIDRKVNPQVKAVNRMLGKEKLSILSYKGKKDLNLFLYNRLKAMPEVTFRDLESLKREAISIIIKVKNSHFKDNLISKDNAKKRIITEEIDYYDLLKDADKRKINTIINYNLRLINSKGLISFEDYKSLVEIIRQELDKFNLRYVISKKLKQELLSSQRTKELLSYRTPVEQQRLFKYLNRIINTEENIYSNKAQESIKREFIAKLLGLKR
jgi:hypothetical protein